MKASVQNDEVILIKADFPFHILVFKYFISSWETIQLEAKTGVKKKMPRNQAMSFAGGRWARGAAARQPSGRVLPGDSLPPGWGDPAPAGSRCLSAQSREQSPFSSSQPKYLRPRERSPLGAGQGKAEAPAPSTAPALGSGFELCPVMLWPPKMFCFVSSLLNSFWGLFFALCPWLRGKNKWAESSGQETLDNVFCFQNIVFTRNSLRYSA